MILMLVNTKLFEPPSGALLPRNEIHHIIGCIPAWQMHLITIPAASTAPRTSRKKIPSLDRCPTCYRKLPRAGSLPKPHGGRNIPRRMASAGTTIWYLRFGNRDSAGLISNAERQTGQASFLPSQPATIDRFDRIGHKPFAKGERAPAGFCV